jgi:hypothetical protein
MPETEAVFKGLEDNADTIGKQHGTTAATWYFNSTTPDEDDFRAVLKGIEDGDPVILDTFLGNPLSGESADDWTPKDLLNYIGAPDTLSEEEESELCEVYEKSWLGAYQDRIIQECLSGLDYEVKVSFYIDVVLKDRDEFQTLVDKAEAVFMDHGDVSAVLSEWGKV